MPGFANFPLPDPIPMPAPVWLFKALHGTVLSLHFVTVQLVLGWLLIGIIWNITGRRRGDERRVAGSSQIARALPFLMTYLINLGIPPLLFTQVLYGNFLYTSSVLIGVWWLSVIFLVILLYSLLYVANERDGSGKAWWGVGLLALLTGLAIAKIYSSNMTLMLRPGVWEEMFRAHPNGTGLPHGDATLFPRWLYMLTGSLTVGGLGLVVAGIWRRNTEALKAILVGQGGALAAAGAALQTAVAFRFFQAQPEAVRLKLTESAFYQLLPWVWLGLAAGVIGLGAVAMVRREKAGGFLALAATLAGLLLTAVAVIYRDGVRDITLALQGYDVWNQKIVENWPVVGLFLAVFVAGLLALGWMVFLAYKAKPIQKEVLP